ncbi:hypothetical protein H072_217 [Dactylellina haptotyla CBS 200.50]|uniref:Thioredoxin-like fold domain-containing protein n=1 Tax=Dactylellina haptotyla (strain CBS 200.50) TaxID=1284197 RepID=S8AXJ9_DACHA|nr:hypothetical protein H072_217 [Dactylellina haptotyla CBS 200.50]
MASTTAAPTAKNGNTVVLYAFEKHPNTPTSSGFCQKIECYFRFAAIPYTQTDTLPHKAPKKKLPYVTVDGVVIPDSQFIVRYVKENGVADLDKRAGLTPFQVSESLAYRGFWEEAIYPAVVRSRWFSKVNEPVIAKEIFGDLPLFIRVPLRWWFRRSLTNALTQQGIGRHTDAEVDTILREALQALEVRLAPTEASTSLTPWFHNTATPTDIDAVLSAMLINILGTESNPFCKQIVLQSKVLRGYTKMVVESYFPEFTTVLGEIKGAENTDGQE